MKRKTPETSVWSSMTSAFSRDLGEFVSEVKKEQFNTGEKKTKTTRPKKFSEQKWRQSVRSWERESNAQEKIETLQAEIDRLKSSSGIRRQFQGSWVKPTPICGQGGRGGLAYGWPPNFLKHIYCYSLGNRYDPDHHLDHYSYDVQSPRFSWSKQPPYSPSVHRFSPFSCAIHERVTDLCFRSQHLYHCSEPYPSWTETRNRFEAAYHPRVVVVVTWVPWIPFPTRLSLLKLAIAAQKLCLNPSFKESNADRKRWHPRVSIPPEAQTLCCSTWLTIETRRTSADSDVLDGLRVPHPHLRACSRNVWCIPRFQRILSSSRVYLEMCWVWVFEWVWVWGVSEWVSDSGEHQGHQRTTLPRVIKAWKHQMYPPAALSRFSLLLGKSWFKDDRAPRHSTEVRAIRSYPERRKYRHSVLSTRTKVFQILLRVLKKASPALYLGVCLLVYSLRLGSKWLHVRRTSLTTSLRISWSINILPQLFLFFFLVLFCVASWVMSSSSQFQSPSSSRFQPLLGVSSRVNFVLIGIGIIGIRVIENTFLFFLLRSSTQHVHQWIFLLLFLLLIVFCVLLLLSSGARVWDIADLGEFGDNVLLGFVVLSIYQSQIYPSQIYYCFAFLCGFLVRTATMTFL